MHVTFYRKYKFVFWKYVIIGNGCYYKTYLPINLFKNWYIDTHNSYQIKVTIKEKRGKFYNLGEYHKKTHHADVFVEDSFAK